MSRAATLLLGVGLLQMSADLLSMDKVRAVALASGASPAPKVFTSHRGLETFSLGFELGFEINGKIRTLRINAERYSRLRGPYNRRNVYGAALAFGPLLATEPRQAPMHRALLERALCGHAPLLRELGVDPDRLGPVRWARVIPRAGVDIGDLPTTFKVRCP